ncbi:MAG TPA: SNF2-related protein [Fimbriimonas sp.]|nr:SNF2-related protein [Fimbriimonas sp.]
MATTLIQTLTPYHAKYYAYELTRRCPPDSDDRVASALVDAQVDLNPHQVDAALFSFKSPLSKGVLLADEVGLGKTIEAGLVIAQKWAERKRRILVVTPSNLRKQWHQELNDKFFLPCRILEAKSYNEAIRAGRFRPFEPDGQIVICSYQFARNKATDVHGTVWDLVVMDEAHRLRNVYKPSNVIANTLKEALASAPKLLLTATPLQNSLLELFGLVSVIDDQVFGDLRSFREQFTDLSQDQVFATLKRRLAPLCHRTLRRQVTAYVSYTKRLPLVEQFTPDDSEDRLYDLVSEYLRRDNLKALPSGQRTLMTLVMRKLLASSSFAIAGALETLANRLKATLAKQAPEESLPDELDKDYEALDETVEEWEAEDPLPPLSPEDREALVREIADLDQFRDLATSITRNAKGDALLKALHVAFEKAAELGGAKKAIIFTESRRTQLYLQRLLADSPWKDGLVLFNGSNTDEQSRAIYAEWRSRHEGTDRVTGSKSADMRSALVDYFHDQGQIMIATEAGAEGINLQFCSLVVNYDLPWNPQRIEQRIGRCHRYGQKHDVVVVNFLNRKNAADQRVFQLLSEKFQLFEGVFGASDEVLGAIESGVDFEKRINSIYQRCRKTDEIQTAFDRLQLELDLEITDTFNKARQQLLEHFDDEVREKLRVRSESSIASLNRYEQHLMALTKFELGKDATFLTESSFDLHKSPVDADVPTGRYELPRRSGEAHFYRLGHPLAEAVVTRAKSRLLQDGPDLELQVNYSNHVGKISVLEPLRGTTGMLRLDCLTVETLGQAEDHLILSAVTIDGETVPADVATRLLTISGTVDRRKGQLPLDNAERREAILAKVAEVARDQETVVRRVASERSARAFEAEAEKLDGWADDLKLGLEREIKELDRQIKEARTAARIAVSLEGKLASQKRMKALESERNNRRRVLFESQDEIDRKRGEMITRLEAQLTQKVTSECFFCLPWRVI